MQPPMPATPKHAAEHHVSANSQAPSGSSTTVPYQQVVTEEGIPGEPSLGDGNASTAARPVQSSDRSGNANRLERQAAPSTRGDTYIGEQEQRMNAREERRLKRDANRAAATPDFRMDTSASASAVHPRGQGSAAFRDEGNSAPEVDSVDILAIPPIEVPEPGQHQGETSRRTTGWTSGPQSAITQRAFRNISDDEERPQEISPARYGGTQRVDQALSDQGYVPPGSADRPGHAGRGTQYRESDDFSVNAASESGDYIGSQNIDRNMASDDVNRPRGENRLDQFAGGRASASSRDASPEVARRRPPQGIWGTSATFSTTRSPEGLGQRVGHNPVDTLYAPGAPGDFMGDRPLGQEESRHSTPGSSDDEQGSTSPRGRTPMERRDAEPVETGPDTGKARTRKERSSHHISDDEGRRTGDAGPRRISRGGVSTEASRAYFFAFTASVGSAFAGGRWTKPRGEAS